MPPEIHGPRVRILREQGGLSERGLKDPLVALFRPTECVHRAYWRGPVWASEGVVLCLKAIGGAEREVVFKIGATFSMIFNTRVHLDIMFLDAKQEAEL